MTYKMIKITETEKYIIHDALENLNTQQIEKSILNISGKIPDKNISLELINDLNNKNRKEYISYDNYIYHKKYDKYDCVKYNIIDEKQKKYFNMLYIQCCSWLIDEIENMIANIVNCEINNNYEYKKIYDNNNITNIMMMSLLKSYNDVKYTYCKIVVDTWFSKKMILPYDYVKDIVNKKGYDIYINTTDEKIELIIKITKKRERE